MSAKSRAVDLKTYAEGRSTPFTYDDIHKKFDWNYHEFMGAVRRVRQTLAREGKNLICEPQGMGERWGYRIVDNYKDAKTWMSFRDKSCDSAIKTTLAVSQSMLIASTGEHTIEAKKARLRVRHLKRLSEDLAELIETTYIKSA